MPKRKRRVGIIGKRKVHTSEGKKTWVRERDPHPGPASVASYDTQPTWQGLYSTYPRDFPFREPSLLAPYLWTLRIYFPLPYLPFSLWLFLSHTYCALSYLSLPTLPYVNLPFLEPRLLEPYLMTCPTRSPLPYPSLSDLPWPSLLYLTLHHPILPCLYLALPCSLLPINVPTRCPTVFSPPSCSSVTLWEETAPVKLPTRHCPH